MARERQNIKSTVIKTTAGNVDAWVELTSKLAARENIHIENTGVNGDGKTAHKLDILFLETGNAMAGYPHSILFAGESIGGNYATEIRIAVRSDVENGTFTLLEFENVSKTGARGYDD